MAYSNGYNLSAVQAKLLGRLAWSTDSTLNTANKTSASGRYFDDGTFHSVVTVPNIKAVVAEPSDWDVYFAAKQNAVIAKCLNAVFAEPEFKEQILLYERFDEQEELVTNSGNAIGYRIKLAKCFDISVQVNSLQLYFDGAATFNVYLFKQGSLSPVKTKSVTTVANAKTEVSLTDWILNFRESSVYYVVYFQDDLSDVKAIQEQACYAKTLFFSAELFYTETTGSNFNRTELSYTVNRPYGLNMQVSSFKDYTQNILNQPHLFDDLLGLVMAYQVVEEIIYSVRENKTERITKDQLAKIGLQLDLTGAAPITDSPRIKGLAQRIASATDIVRKAFYPKPKAQTVDLLCS